MRTALPWGRTPLCASAEGSAYFLLQQATQGKVGQGWGCEGSPAILDESNQSSMLTMNFGGNRGGRKEQSGSIRQLAEWLKSLPGQWVVSWDPYCLSQLPLPSFQPWAGDIIPWVPLDVSACSGEVGQCPLPQGFPLGLIKYFSCVKCFKALTCLWCTPSYFFYFSFFY